MILDGPLVKAGNQGANPATHHSQRQHHIKPIDSPLYVVCCISNPQRFYSRHKHYYMFEKHIRDSGAILITVELALGERHHELTSPDNPHHIQLRSQHEIWFKENLWNIGVRRFPPDWKYGAGVDADIIFTRPDWVNETLHQLQHYHWVQMFSTITDLDKRHQPLQTWPGFVYALKECDEASRYLNEVTPNGIKSKYGDFGVMCSGFSPPEPFDPAKPAKKGMFIGQTGFGWAWRREAFDRVGSLLDTCVIGSADWHMAYALAGVTDWTAERIRCTKGYVKRLEQWAERAAQFKDKIGFVDCHAVHYWHGPRSNRFYQTRWKYLQDHQFNPETDLSYDWQGVLRWNGNKPSLEEALRVYFRSRDEDV